MPIYYICMLTGVHVRSLLWERGHWLVLDGMGGLFKIELPEVRGKGGNIFLLAVLPLIVSSLSRDTFSSLLLFLLLKRQTMFSPTPESCPHTQ